VIGRTYHQAIEAGEWVAQVLCQHMRRAAHVVAPIARRCFGDGRLDVQLERRKLRLDVGEVNACVGARTCDDHDVFVQRSRQDKAVIVVGVLADQVDAPRRAQDGDIACRAEAVVKGLDCGHVAHCLVCGAVTVDVGQK
jgi:hypothetical protein